MTLTITGASDQSAFVYFITPDGQEPRRRVPALSRQKQTTDRRAVSHLFPRGLQSALET